MQGENKGKAKQIVLQHHDLAETTKLPMTYVSQTDGIKKILGYLTSTHV